MLHHHRATTATPLVAALGGLLAVPPADPFASEVIAVPTRGVERWLTQRLSNELGTSGGQRHDGILANVRFPSPREVVDQAVAAACGLDPDADVWSPERILWPLLDVVDEHLEEPWLAILSDHLRDSAADQDLGMTTRRLSAVRHLAVLFDRYALQRPAMVRAWREGAGTGGSGVPLPPHLAWQAELWRHLRERVGAPGPAERLTHAVGRLEADPTLADLPDRFALFGLTRLPAAHLQILDAIAAHRDVHLFLLHPSPALWARIAQQPPAPSARRAEDPTAVLPRNRLLASWGRDARELQLVLNTTTHDHADLPHDPDPDAGPDPDADRDRDRDPDKHRPRTLLARLQADIRTDAHAAGPPPLGSPDVRPLHATDDDHSLTIHSCHGRARQVQVLRDAILHALQDDATLQPRDVIVMCPDIEAFAPLIQATFGVGDALDEDRTGDATQPDDPPSSTPTPPDLRVRLADRALRQTNPVLGAISRLLELADQRFTAAQLLDLADRAPVRRRFHLDDDDLARIEGWVVDTNVRWGLDAEQRAPFKLAPVAANTWRAGVDRVLLGVTMTEDALALVGGVLPYDDVDSGAIDLAGRLAELLDRTGAAVTAFATPMPLTSWTTAIARAADLLCATSPRDAWQRAQLDRLLAQLRQDSQTTGDHATLALFEVRDLLDEHLRGRPTRANFRTGHLTCCTLSPMRSVPHRVVGLLGMDDTVFPRKAPRDGDDLIFEDPHVGDRDARAEDRQMLLDALMAAQDRLIVTFSGNDERTNATRPPAVPVGELLDTVDRTVRTPSGRARDAILVRHPLQPFDPRTFTPGALGAATTSGPFGFDHVALAGARSLVAPRTPRPPFLDGPLPPPPGRVIDLEDLVRFVQHPARAFLRQRLGVSLREASDDLGDALPIDLDALEKWGVGERLLQGLLIGHEPPQALAAEKARGTLPPGHLADETLTAIGADVQAIARAVRELPSDGAAPASLDARVLMPDERLISGTVPGLRGDVLRAVSFSRVSPKTRLAAWVRLLALTATWPERPLEAVAIGRRRSGAGVTVARIPPLGADADSRRTAAHEQLAVLLNLYDRAMREPPPLACATSAAYAAAVHAGRAPFKAAGAAWTSGWDYPKEDQDLEHQELFGGVLSFEDLLAQAPRADEAGDGWDTGQPSRLGRWAVRLWAGLLAVEDVQDR